MNGYFFKFEGVYTKPLYQLPRWMSSNSYEDLFDDVQVPLVSTFSNHTTCPTSLVPSLFPTLGVPGSCIFLQGFVENVVNEISLMIPESTSVNLSKSFWYNLCDIAVGWVCNVGTTVPYTVEVQCADSSWITVNQASDDGTLIYSPFWQWYLFNNVLMIAGLDITTQNTENRGDSWQYIKYQELWDQTGQSWIEHPVTKNWIPINYTDIRSDGWLNYWYQGSTRFRSRNSSLAESVSAVTIRINGTELLTAHRRNLWNSVDTKGLWFNVTRRHGESNLTLSDTILNTSWFQGMTNNSLQLSVSSKLRSSTLYNVSPTSTGFTLPANSTGYGVRNINQDWYVQENNLVPDPNSINGFISQFIQPSLGFAILDNIITTFTGSGSIIYLNGYVDNTIQSPNVSWKLRLWNQIGNNLSFTPNMPTNIPNLLILSSSKVLVSYGDQPTLIKAFNDTSPSLYWQRSTDTDTISGLAVFV